MPEVFEHLFKVISGKRFLSKQGIGKEVPFFICPFLPEDAIEMEQTQRQLSKRLEQAGVRVLTVNLYDLSIELLKERGIWEQLFEIEQASTKTVFKEDLLDGVLDTAKYLVPAIGAKMRTTEFDVLFICGIGEVFPFIRSHTVLNNLQSTAKEVPTVMFFPGAYAYSLESGASLELFGRLRDDKYYRAFNILHVEP